MRAAAAVGVLILAGVVVWYVGAVGREMGRLVDLFMSLPPEVRAQLFHVKRSRRG